ncbi:hypothetical protein VTK56DRAFT_8276 [Thermocarpiscus australiensis]
MVDQPRLLTERLFQERLGNVACSSNCTVIRLYDHRTVHTTYPVSSVQVPGRHSMSTMPSAEMRIFRGFEAALWVCGSRWGLQTSRQPDSDTRGNGAGIALPYFVAFTYNVTGWATCLA